MDGDWKTDPESRQLPFQPDESTVQEPARYELGMTKKLEVDKIRALAKFC